MAVLNCVLALNSGSSSIKFAVYAGDELRLQGKLERIGLEGSLFRVTDATGRTVREERRAVPDHAVALTLVLECARVHKVEAVGHRLVRGGIEDREPQLVTPALLSRLREMIPYFPEHLPQQVLAIELICRADASLQQVVCFDTSFHRVMPRIAQLYPLPRNLADDGILRYGFHGISYEYVYGEW